MFRLKRVFEGSLLAYGNTLVLDGNGAKLNVFRSSLEFDFFGTKTLFSDISLLFRASDLDLAHCASVGLSSSEGACSRRFFARRITV